MADDTASISLDLTALSAALIDAARAAGAEAADVLVAETSSVSVSVRGGNLEEAERTEAVECGLRVLIGCRQASVASSDIRPDTLRRVAERAVAMAREAPEDPYVGLADPADLAADCDTSSLDLVDPGADPDPEMLAEDARRAEAAALAVPGVSRIDVAGARYGRDRMHISATNGFSGGYQFTTRSLSCVAITGSGTEMERDWDHDWRVYGADMRGPEEIGRVAGERAASRAGSRKAKTGRYPVLYDERVAGSLIGHLMQAINGTAISRGASFLRGALGEEVLPRGLSLSEEPHRPRTPTSRLFDAEGLPTQPRSIVADGVLQGWTLDLATARKLGLKSTANAARGTGGPPSPSVTNLALTQGDKSRDALLSEMGTGLLVTSMIGSTINPNTGDYSRGASGFWVENGVPVHPVSEITIAGNLRDMLRRIVPANDARPWLSRVVPSLLVDGMTLAGD